MYNITIVISLCVCLCVPSWLPPHFNISDFSSQWWLEVAVAKASFPTGLHLARASRGSKCKDQGLYKYFNIQAMRCHQSPLWEKVGLRFVQLESEGLKGVWSGSRGKPETLSWDDKKPWGSPFPFPWNPAKFCGIWRPPWSTRRGWCRPQGKMGVKQLRVGRKGWNRVEPRAARSSANRWFLKTEVPGDHTPKCEGEEYTDCHLRQFCIFCSIIYNIKIKYKKCVELSWHNSLSCTSTSSSPTCRTAGCCCSSDVR
jgi:hypothetical protein